MNSNFYPCHFLSPWWTSVFLPLLIFIYWAASWLGCKANFHSSTEDLPWLRVGSAAHAGFAPVGACSLSDCAPPAPPGARERGPSACLPRLNFPVGCWIFSSPTRVRTCLPCIGRWLLNCWTTRKFLVFLKDMETSFFFFFIFKGCCWFCNYLLTFFFFSSLCHFTAFWTSFWPWILIYFCIVVPLYTITFPLLFSPFSLCFGF